MRSLGTADLRSPEEIQRFAHRLDALLSTLAAGIVETDLAGRITYANPYVLRLLKLTEEELLGRTEAELGIERYDESGASVPAARVLEQEGADTPDVAHAVNRYVRREAEVDVWLESQTTLLRALTGEPTGVVISLVDVTDRFRLAAVERSGLERMTKVLGSMPTGVMLVDPAGRIEYANPAAPAISGLKPEDVIGQLAADPAWQLTDEGGRPVPYDELPVPTVLRERREVRGVELGVPTLSGTTRWLRVGAFPLFEAGGDLRGAVVTTEDITERRALSEQLLQAQKIEGIGQLAGGIAHDFNNLLSVILGNAEIALARPAAVATCLSEIRDAALRGATLTRQLLTFARKQAGHPRTVYLDRLALAVEQLLRRTLGEQITLVRTSDPELWPVKIDPGHVEQLLVNLAINARDAMPGGGLLVIETRNRTINAREAKAHPEVEPGDFVMLSIRDTGEGMSRDVLAHIFEPFFTTKPPGSGSGLGLSICHGVVRQAHGFISVESEPGHGTTFQIYLPRTAAAPADVAPPTEAPLAKGKGNILLVEDEDGVRSFVTRALRGYGYEVVSASTAKHALAMQERMTGQLDLLLTDLVMPGMNGLDLASELRSRVPGLRVLYMTGYFDAQGLDNAELNVDENLLLKPFTPMELVRRVQRLLAQDLPEPPAP